MAKQSFSTGQVLTAAQMTSLQQTAMGGGSPSTKTASYVLTAADAGTVIQMNSASATTITVNTSLFAAGDSVQIQNIGAGVCTITAGTATVNSAGTLGVTQYDGGFLYFSSASSAIWFDYTQAGTALPLTTKGDLFGYSTTNARIPVGANATVLTADSTEALGVKWATPASGGGMTLLSTTTLSGTNVTVSSIDQGYTNLVGFIYGITASAADINTLKPNISTTGGTICGTLMNSSDDSVVVASEAINANAFQFTSNNAYFLRTNANNAIQFTIYNYSASVGYKLITSTASGLSTAGTNCNIDSVGIHRSAAAITEIAISGVSYTAGTLKLYGVK